MGKAGAAMEDFEKAQGTNKARTEQMLQAKLKERQSRREAQQQQEKELAAMNKGGNKKPRKGR